MDYPSLYLIGVRHQPFFTGLEHLALSQYCLSIGVILRLAQSFGNLRQLDDRPSQIRRNVLKIAPQVLLKFVEPHDDLLKINAAPDPIPCSK
jgi:hypothetical protein